MLGRAAAGIIAGLSCLFAWWAWKQGAFFGPVFYPGAFVVFALLGMLAAFASFSGRVGGPARIAALSLLGLGVWSTLSTVWSPTPATAIAYGMHIFLYAAMFAIGLWVTNMLRGKMRFALAPLAIAGAAIGIGVVVVLATGTDTTWYLHDDATLRFPIGYRNANAAFFLICFWPLVALAAEFDLRWELRALMVGAGTMLLELAFISQSRGSIPALIAALLVYLVLAPNRQRAAAVLALAAVPMLPAIHVLLNVYGFGHYGPGVVPLLRDAARAIGVTTALSVLLAAVVFRGIAPRLRLERKTVVWSSRIVAITALVAVLGGGAIFVARHGGPVGFVDQRVKQFDRVGYPDLHGQGIRFGANVGSNRHDFWRVAAREGLDHPLLGGGAGSFQVVYLKHRLSDESPQDPHSAEMLVFSELGFPGLLLLGAFVVGAVLAGMRSRRLGPAAASLTAASFAVGTQWIVHSSFDWFWNYPGVTAPTIFALGAATAPALFHPTSGHPSRLRSGIAMAMTTAVALLVIPLYLSGRYAQNASDEGVRDPSGAIADLDRAARLNPLDAGPLLTKGEIESRLGERREALRAWRQAAGREPDNYAAFYFIARELARVDPLIAESYLRRALELNPRDPTLKALQARLEKVGTRTGGGLPFARSG